MNVIMNVDSTKLSTHAPDVVDARISYKTAKDLAKKDQVEKTLKMLNVLIDSNETPNDILIKAKFFKAKILTSNCKWSEASLICQDIISSAHASHNDIAKAKINLAFIQNGINPHLMIPLFNQIINQADVNAKTKALASLSMAMVMPNSNLSLQMKMCKEIIDKNISKRTTFYAIDILAKLNCRKGNFDEAIKLHSQVISNSSNKNEKTDAAIKKANILFNDLKNQQEAFQVLDEIINDFDSNEAHRRKARQAKVKMLLKSGTNTDALQKNLNEAKILNDEIIKDLFVNDHTRLNTKYENLKIYSRLLNLNYDERLFKEATKLYQEIIDNRHITKRNITLAKCVIASINLIKGKFLIDIDFNLGMSHIYKAFLFGNDEIRNKCEKFTSLLNLKTIRQLTTRSYYQLLFSEEKDQIITKNNIWNHEQYGLDIKEFFSVMLKIQGEYEQTVHQKIIAHFVMEQHNLSEYIDASNQEEVDALSKLMLAEARNQASKNRDLALLLYKRISTHALPYHNAIVESLKLELDNAKNQKEVNECLNKYEEQFRQELKQISDNNSKNPSRSALIEFYEKALTIVERKRTYASMASEDQQERPSKKIKSVDLTDV